jgi:hypothetical protein
VILNVEIATARTYYEDDAERELRRMILEVVGEWAEKRDKKINRLRFFKAAKPS